MRLITIVFLCVATTVGAGPRQATVDAILNEHVLPRMTTLAVSARRLDDTARLHCDPHSDQLRAAWGEAFDGWTAISHLRFGPVETASRGFALAFWPDSRSKAPKALTRLMAERDPSVTDPARFATVSVAARGFYALEYLLYDPAYADAGDGDYRCALIRAITGGIATSAEAIARDWTESYAAQMRAPGDGQLYQSEEEVLQEFFKALNTGLMINAELRLGRPLGTYDRPRPIRAEARRSGRSLHNVALSLIALRELAGLLAAGEPEEAARLDRDFDRALHRAETLDDPVFAGVADAQGRLRVEVLQQAIQLIGEHSTQYLGPSLGVAAGFNSLDGD